MARPGARGEPAPAMARPQCRSADRPELRMELACQLQPGGAWPWQDPIKPLLNLKRGFNTTCIPVMNNSNLLAELRQKGRRNAASSKQSV